MRPGERGKETVPTYLSTLITPPQVCAVLAGGLVVAGIIVTAPEPVTRVGAAKQLPTHGTGTLEGRLVFSRIDAEGKYSSKTGRKESVGICALCGGLHSSAF